MKRLLPSFRSLRCHIRSISPPAPWLHHLLITLLIPPSAQTLINGVIGFNLWTSSLAVVLALPKFQTYISNCLVNSSTWMSNRHFKLSLYKTEPLIYKQAPLPSTVVFLYLSKRQPHFSPCSDQNLKTSY